MNKPLISKLVLVVMLLTTVSGYAVKQQALKERLFKKVDELFAQAKSEQADLLSPTLYSKAVTGYEEATRDFEKGKTVEKKLIEIETLLQQSLENAKLAKVTFPSLLTAREDALIANAPQYALEDYEIGEREFSEAARSIEKGDLNKARDRALKGEKLFRDAELKAIKNSIVGNVRNLIEKARNEAVEKYAPQTLSLATKLLFETENILNSDKGAKSDALEKAEQAEYEASHAIYLARKIKTLRENDKNWEKLILENEEYFSRIVKTLDFKAQFDEGLEKPTSSVIVAIKNLKDENKRLNQELTEQNKELADQGEQIQALSARLDEVKQKQAGLQARLDIEKKKEEKYNKIEQIFTPVETKILREGDKITMRLMALNFPSAKAVINPENFSLLSKVQQAIRVFPDYHVTVEGHTDSRGDDRYNERLSMDRANAVREYLIANMGLSGDQITAIGYGESRPIASNDSEAGREKNRRIDIVLSPKMR